ncbi:MAG: HD domain-containing protein [Jatrophihabitans sp.]
MVSIPALPGHPDAMRALELVRSHERPAVANHSVRTYLHAVLAARARQMTPGTDYDGDLLFYACVLHDIGTSDSYDGPKRFEVEGADAAAAFLTEAGIAAERVDQVWEAIALHTSPQIAERRGPITLLTRLGIRADFSGPGADRSLLEQHYPRLDVERELTAAVIGQAMRQPDKAPNSSWPGNLLRAHLAAPDDPDARLKGF